MAIAAAPCPKGPVKWRQEDDATWDTTWRVSANEVLRIRHVSQGEDGRGRLRWRAVPWEPAPE